MTGAVTSAPPRPVFLPRQVLRLHVRALGPAEAQPQAARRPRGARTFAAAGGSGVPGPRLSQLPAPRLQRGL